MTRIATAHVTSTASPAAFFARWADMATWPEWNLDTEWVRLDGPFVEGATGTLKPKGGPKVPFVVARLTAHEFVDVSKLLGARLTFAHRVTSAEDKTEVSVEASISGPLAAVWRLILGKGIAASAQPDLERLAAAAEADQR
jgi:Polyketide cyclase / dehydrase and lipid transport